MMDESRVIVRREYQKILLSDFDLTDSEIDQFEIQAEIAAKKLRVSPSEVLNRHRNSLKCGSVVGVLAIPNRTIEILPKIDGEESKVREALVHILKVAHDLPISDHELSTLKFQRRDLLEILIRIFAVRLNGAVRKGIPRRYEVHEGEVAVVRGKLNIPRQFTRYAGRTDQLACIWDELTQNTPLNRVLKVTVRFLLSMTKSIANRRLLITLLEMYDAVSDSRNPLSERVSLDRINTEFHDLYKLAKYFLSHRFQSTTSGRGLGFTLLFSMNELFENFIGKCIKNALEPRGSDVRLQHQKHYAIRERSDHSKCLFKLKPDVVIKPKGGANETILDTKWKKLEHSDKKLGINQSDIYQVLTYGRAYDASRIILLYPWYRNISDCQGIISQWDAVGVSELHLDIATIDIGQPWNCASELAKLFPLN